VALVYFDASALVKLAVEEHGSDLAARLWDGCDAPVASRLTFVEACAALASAERNRDLSRSSADLALGTLDQLWRAVRAIELTEEVQVLAGRLAGERSLRGADAVHLASALAVGDPDLVVAVWDRRLALAAQASGLAVAPPP